jgi:serine/threonine protein kinase
MARDRLLGAQLANFRIERLIGSGGMARVYLGTDVTLQRPVAIKVIDEKHRDTAYADRFLSEARIVASWRHENICQIYYADKQEDLLYYVMEYIDGMDLSELLSSFISQGELIPHEDVILIGRGIARALDYAHERGVIHRDIKPANVLIDRDGRVILTDFGLAKDINRESLQEVFGTAHYIAPEQAQSSESVVPQSDVYALGIILYEMLTGVVPFDDPSPVVVALQHVNREPQKPRAINPNLTPTTEAILLKALEKNPADRFQTAAKLMDNLERALEPAMSATASFMPLPPLPAGARAKGALPVSGTSIIDRLAARPESSTRQKTQPLSQYLASQNLIPAARAPGKRRNYGMWISAILGALLLGWLAWYGYNSLTAPPPVARLTPTPTTASPAPSETAAPIPTPTDTVTPTPSLVPTATAIPSPTVLHPGGLRFQIYYDQTSFQLLNSSGIRVEIRPIAFQRFNADGSLVTEFTGAEWARYNLTIRDGTCMRIVITTFASDEIYNPPECGNIYEAVRNALRPDHVLNFWTVERGAPEFIVLWEGQEIARCEVDAGYCEIFLPPATPTP